MWSGALMEELGLLHLHRAIYLPTIGGKVAGDVLNIFLAQRWGRLRTLRLGFLGATLSTLGYALPGLGSASVITIAFCQGVFTDILWCNMYIYLVERLPTTVRSTGFGFAMGLGRSGGVVSSALGGLFSSMQTAFITYAAAFALGAAVAFFPSVETARRPLADTVA